MAEVRLICGPWRSKRTQQIDDIVLAHGDRALLLVPTGLQANQRIENLVLNSNRPGFWGRPVSTFPEFVKALLQKERFVFRSVEGLERRLLLERVIYEQGAAGKLDMLRDAAQTPGFVSHIERVVTQLKQATVEPATFRATLARREPPMWLDPIVADIYEGFQEALIAAEAYDLVGLYWKAARLSNDQCPKLIETVDTLVLDGFDDFTPSELQLLKSLAHHTAHLVFGLNCTMNEPAQKDLYALPLDTAELLRQHFPERVVETFEERAAKSFAEFAASWVFWRDRRPPPHQITANMILQPCAGARQEMEAVGRRIKALLIEDGVSPASIAVVYRRLDDIGPMLRTVFAEFGIPLRILQKPRLSESSLVRFLLQLFETVDEWTRDTVVDVITSPWFRPTGVQTPEETEGAAALARLAGIVAGREAFRTRLDALAKRLENKDSVDWAQLNKLVAEPRAALGALQRRFDALASTADLLPSNGALADFAHAMEKILDELHVQDAVESERDISEDFRAFEMAALERLRHLLSLLSRQDPGLSMSRAAFASRLKRISNDVEVDLAEPRDGVQCLTPEEGRGLFFNHVFYAGVNEGAVPRPAPVSAIYGESDVEAFEHAGVHLERRQTHAKRELLMFHHVLSMARESIWISWQTVSAEGRPLAPSPYITDLRELLPEEQVVQKRISPLETFAPPPEEAACERDVRNAAFSSHPELRDRFRGLFAPASAGAEVERSRQSALPFDAYDGVLEAPEVIDMVAQSFGPTHVYSVAQLETYALCPFRFFVERVLQVEEPETPVVELESTARGALVHAVLEHLHARFRGLAVSEIPEAEARQAMRETVGEVFSSMMPANATVQGGLLRVERDRMVRLLDQYLAIAREEKDSFWKPQHFEVRFGRVDRFSAEPLNKSEPFMLDTRAGAFPFSGKIDRIDENGEEVRIIDYKTTVRVTAKNIDEGVSLQLPLYALAVEEHLLPGRRCAEALFVQVGRDRKLEGLDRKKKWEQREATLRESVARYVQAIREGRFPPTPRNSEACTYCPARQVCRHEEGRIERKQGAAP